MKLTVPKKSHPQETRVADGGAPLLADADLVLKVLAPDPDELSAMR